MGSGSNTYSAVVTLLVAVVLCISFSSCNSSTQVYGQQTQPDDTPESQTDHSPPRDFPPFPGTQGDAVSVVRQASDTTTVVPGSDYTDEQGAGNRPGETDPAGYIIAPGGDDDLAWAIYGIGGFDFERPVDIEIEADGVIAPGGDVDLPMSFWIGVSNFSSYSWEWFGPYADPTSLVLNSSVIRDRYVSFTNNFFYTVVVDSSGIDPTSENPDGIAAVEVIAASTDAVDALSAQYFDTVPHYPIDIELLLEHRGGSALDPDSQYAYINWTHMNDSASAKNEASFYEVFRSRKDGPDEGMIRLGLVMAPGSEFIDPKDTVPPAGPPLPGEVYLYFVKAKSPVGSTPYAHRDTSAIPMLPPQNLSASYGLYTDRVVLNWEAAEGAARYQIYRDNPTTPFASVDNLTSWTDFSVTDNNKYSYWVRGVNRYNHGGTLSNMAPGKLNSPPVAAIAVGPGQDKGSPPLQVDFSGFSSNDPDDLGPGNGIVLYEWDIDGDGIYEYASDEPQYQYVYDSRYYTVTAVLRVTDIAGTTATDSIEIHVNDRPVAVLIAEPTTLKIDDKVDFDARLSSDPNGTIVDYEWDFDGDGIFNESDNDEDNERGEATGYVKYKVAGSYNLTLRVTDNDGGTDTDSIVITVTEN